MSEMSATISIPLVSVAFPVFNEAENLEMLHAEVTRALETTGLAFELIFVDNGSTDASLSIIKRLSETDPRVEFVSLSRNFGHQGALLAGISHAQGEAVITMDADLQHPSALLPEMVRLWQEGFEVVFTRKRRYPVHGMRLRQVKLFYWLMSKWSGLHLSFGQSDFRLLDRKVFEVFLRMPEARKFLRGLVEWVGFRQTGLEYDPLPRHAGESKFPFRALVSFAVDGIISFSLLPLRWSLGLGFIVASMSFVYGIAMVVMGLLNYAGMSVPLPPGWATLVVSILFLSGIQLIAIGMLGEYVGRIFEQTKGRPEFIVRAASVSEREPR
ncbi:MAG: glycosyltransferase [Acidobacteria bacterium]|nr:glycosyltransferase [Acidobacteriota bacterium]